MWIFVRIYLQSLHHFPHSKYSRICPQHPHWAFGMHSTELSTTVQDVKTKNKALQTKVDQQDKEFSRQDEIMAALVERIVYLEEKLLGY